MPLAVLEYCGAMPIGMDHIGPIVISAKKNPPARHATDMYTLWVKIIGTREASASSVQTDSRSCSSQWSLPAPETAR